MLAWQRTLDGEPSMRGSVRRVYFHALASSDYSFADARSYARGYSASLEHFFGSKMDGPEYVALDTGHAAPFSTRDAFIAALDQHVRPLVPPGRSP